MENSEILWKQFYNTGRVCDYLAYCAVKDVKNCDNEKGASDIGRLGSARNECRGE